MIRIVTRRDSFYFDNKFEVNMSNPKWVQISLKKEIDPCNIVGDGEQYHTTLIPTYLIESIQFD